MAHTLDLPPLEGDVRRLEAQVRRLRRLVLGLTACCLGAVLVAAAAPPVDRLVARSLVLVDDYGQEVASFAAGSDGARLVILHPDTGEVAIRLGVGAGEEGMSQVNPALPETADSPLEARLRLAMERQRQRLLARLEPLSDSELAAAWDALPASQRALLAGTAVEAAVRGEPRVAAVPAVAGAPDRASAFIELRGPGGEVVFYRSAEDETLAHR